jgi:surfactin synthase thioesterase subunit
MAQPMPADMDCVVTDVLDAMRPALADPFVIFGHSMGGLIAYEVARRLAETGPYPECLIVSGTGSPDTADPALVTGMTDQELTDWLIRLGGTPPLVLNHPDLLFVALRALRADLTLLERYGTPEPTAIPVPIAAFGGREDTRAPAWKIEKWQAATSRGFEMRIFPGGHFYLHECREAMLTEIARVVRACAAGTAVPG